MWQHPFLGDLIELRWHGCCYFVQHALGIVGVDPQHKVCMAGITLLRLIPHVIMLYAAQDRVGFTVEAVLDELLGASVEDACALYGSVAALPGRVEGMEVCFQSIELWPPAKRGVVEVCKVNTMLFI